MSQASSIPPSTPSPPPKASDLLQGFINLLDDPLFPNETKVMVREFLTNLLQAHRTQSLTSDLVTKESDLLKEKLQTYLKSINTIQVGAMTFTRTREGEPFVCESLPIDADMM